jgi:hypothetical protein
MEFDDDDDDDKRKVTILGIVLKKKLHTVFTI